MISQILKLLRKRRAAKRLKNRLNYFRVRTSERNKKLFANNLVLTPNEVNEISDYYAKYGLDVNPMFHQFYKFATGKFDVKCIPDDFYCAYIDPYFNNWEMAHYLDNKTLYSQLFSDFNQPKTITYRQNGFWFDSDSQIISKEKAIDLIHSVTKCFLKKATESMGGKNIYVLGNNSTTEEISDIISGVSGDIIVQEGLTQSSTLSKINQSSVNTLRLMTLLRKDGSVKLCSTSLRMGINGASVDNASSGGITVGVNLNGVLNNIAYAANGSKYETHPTSGIKFSDIRIPNYDKVVSAVKMAAVKRPHFRLLSWDIALDENDQPILIEANLCDGELDFHQLNNGPIFGEETEEILAEVFKK